MPNLKIQPLVRRGLAADLPTLATGEFGITTDTDRLYIGSESGNKRLTFYSSGLASAIGTLEVDEFYYATDTEKFYIGTAGGNVLLNPDGSALPYKQAAFRVVYNETTNPTITELYNNIDPGEIFIERGSVGIFVINSPNEQFVIGKTQVILPSIYAGAQLRSYYFSCDLINMSTELISYYSQEETDIGSEAHSDPNQGDNDAEHIIEIRVYD